MLPLSLSRSGMDKYEVSGQLDTNYVSDIQEWDLICLVSFIHMYVRENEQAGVHSSLITIIMGPTRTQIGRSAL